MLQKPADSLDRSPPFSKYVYVSMACDQNRLSAGIFYVALLLQQSRNTDL